LAPIVGLAIGNDRFEVTRAGRCGRSPGLRRMRAPAG
jgi:hypothetical protein